MNQPGQRHDDFVFTVTRIAFDLRRQSEEVAEGLGITSWQGRVLAMLSTERDAPLIQRDITHRGGMPPASVTRLLNGMEADGLLERRTDPSNNRIKTLHILPRGREILAQYRADTDAYAASLLSSLSDDEQSTLLELLHRVAPSFPEFR